MIGIYIIKNKINKKCYVGQSIDIDKRFKSHINGLDGNYGHNPHFQSAWNKYGKDNFEFDVLEEVEDTNSLDDREKYYISLYDSFNQDCGYNMTPGGSMCDDDYREYLQISQRFNNSNLTKDDVRHIKLAMFCLMDRDELSKKYNVSKKVLTKMSMGQSYGYVNPELNELIHNLKQKMIDDRNKEILKLFDRGYRIVDIIEKMGLSESIVSKCIHKYRDIPNKFYNDERIKVYEDIMNLYNQGYNRHQICKILNQPQTTVYKYTDNNFDINKLVELPFKKVKKNVYSYIIDKYFNENKSSKELSNELNLSRNTIEFYINKHKYANTEVS